MSITTPGQIPDDILLKLFKRNLEDNLVKAALADIMPAIEAAAKQAAKDALTGLEPMIRAHFEPHGNQFVITLSTIERKPRP